MFEDEVEQTDESGAEGATADAGDEDVAPAVDQQAAGSSGTSAEAAPEVPDNASDTIAAAQEHINKLNMDEERAAAKKAI